MLPAAMAQRRHHYERAFEAFLRERRIPYVAVDEARKALLPDGIELTVSQTDEHGRVTSTAIKSFDFVLYGRSDEDGEAGGAGGAGNLLVDVKGRRVGGPGASPLGAARLESWVTLEDVASLDRWEQLFGPGFAAAFVFIYLCQAQPPDALFQEIFEHHGQWYALRCVSLKAYRGHMKVRSARWGTVDLPRRVFEQISQPLTTQPAELVRSAGVGGGVGAGVGGASRGENVPRVLLHPLVGV